MPDETEKQKHDVTAYSGLSLDDLRHKIGQVDRKILEDLNERALLSLAVGELKKNEESGPILRPAREKELLSDLAEKNQGPLPDAHLWSIYREILSSSRAMQRKQTVAFLGPMGTYSHQATLEMLGDQIELFPKMRLDDVFAAVDSGECDNGIIPLENSIEGSIGQSFDLFRSYSLFIQAEGHCRIQHSLLSQESSFEAISVVYSHPQPLGQCSQWLKNNLPHAKTVATESTAAAAQKIALEPGSAAIGHSRLAEPLNLRILSEGIEDFSGNWTRFALIGREMNNEPSADKSSIVFSIPHAPGGLFNVLKWLAWAGVNMMKIESRPIKTACWEYSFFADVDCNILDEQYKEVVSRLKEHCQMFRVLGSYPSVLQTGTDRFLR